MTDLYHYLGRKGFVKNAQPEHDTRNTSNRGI